jgi:predicted PurR-regulated permease PerM
MTTFEFFKRAVIAVVVALVPLLVWYFFDLVLVLVAAVLVAVLIEVIAEPFLRWGGLRRGIALTISGIILLGVVAGVSYLFGTRMAAEMQDVITRADAAIATLSDDLQGSEIGKLMLSHVAGSGFSIAGVLGNVFAVSAKFVAGAVVSVVVGFYFVAQPEEYRSGLSKLLPRSWRANAKETMDDLAVALRLWLLGQFIEMIVIGVLSTIAVWLIGLPSPLALGVIAGVAEFIPYVGPIIASIPALLIATTVGWDAALWTLIAYIIIHQSEANLVLPLIQRHMVYIPPAVMLLSVVTISFVFGTTAVIFAAPITVIVFVLVGKLYVRDSLGEPTSLPGETV